MLQRFNHHREGDWVYLNFMWASREGSWNSVWDSSLIILLINTLLVGTWHITSLSWGLEGCVAFGLEIELHLFSWAIRSRDWQLIMWREIKSPRNWGLITHNPPWIYLTWLRRSETHWFKINQHLQSLMFSIFTFCHLLSSILFSCILLSCTFYSLHFTFQHFIFLHFTFTSFIFLALYGFPFNF